MNKKIMICFALTIMIIGCKKVDVDFTYSPAEPKAGEVVKFSNSSSAGENWNWDFGDNATSVLKNPSHTFRKPGTYVVTLMVDSAKYNTCSHTITVYDTIPTFVASTDSICHYIDVTLTANIYNPFNYSLSYEWTLPDNCHLVAGTLTSKAVKIYFDQYGSSMPIALTIKQNEKEYSVSRDLYIHETKAPAIVMQLADYTVKRQRIIESRLETVQNNLVEENVVLLNNSNDTIVHFNGVTFYASQMSSIFPNYEVKRIQLDAMAQKWYITTTEGLFVANFNGEDMVCIDAEAYGAVYVDMYRNLVLWATPSGLKAMALVKSKKNQFSTTPILYNEISDIDRIVVNNNPQ